MRLVLRTERNLSVISAASLSISLAGAREEARGCSMVGVCVVSGGGCGRGRARSVGVGVSRLRIGTAQPRVAGQRASECRRSSDVTGDGRCSGTQTGGGGGADASAAAASVCAKTASEES